MGNWKRRIVPVVFFFLAALAVFSLSAGEGLHPCRHDAEKFCKGVEPGQGRLQKCLKKHKGEISEGCRVKLKEAGKEIKRLKKVCKKDRKKFCRHVEGSERGSIVNCLLQHESKLAPECREACQAKF